LDLYFSYVHKLAKMHLYLENYSEAAHCYLLHSNKIGIGKEIVPAVGTLPKQTTKERKEALLQKAMNYFLEDDDWEQAIKVGKELQSLYEDTYQYSKLKELLPKIGDFFDSILTKSRRKKSYFNVLILGKNAEDRGEYIYRENKILLTEFIGKLKSIRTDCEVIRTQVKPEDIEEYNSKDGICK
jgi:tetratricopeptide (TPR) repeat protein